MWNSILLFTFFHDFRKAFFPLDNRFQGFFRLDGSLCLYLYDYCPVRRNDKITFEGKKISNAVYRFKSGEETDLFGQALSIAASRIRVIQENRYRAVLIPVPGIHPCEAPHPLRGVLPQAVGGHGSCRRLRGDYSHL